ncbi:MAG: hypothetical protein JWP32_2917 [Schumannella sp.]|nr:hypothetical protein [Schumannella sp.]
MADRLVRTDRYSTTDEHGRTTTTIADVFHDGVSEYVKVSTEILTNMLEQCGFTKLDA